MKYPLKLIEWEDAFTGFSSAWTDLAELKPTEPLIMTTVGFEVQRTERQLTLCQSISEEGRGGNLITIPTAAIVREKTLNTRFSTKDLGL